LSRTSKKPIDKLDDKLTIFEEEHPELVDPNGKEEEEEVSPMKLW